MYYNVVVRPSVVCLAVALVRPTQAIEIFDKVLRYMVRWPSIDIRVKFYRDRPRGTPPSGEYKHNALDGETVSSSSINAFKTG